MGDETWRRMPQFMQPEVVLMVASRIQQHCKIHGLREIAIGLHGGEPLLYGKVRTRFLLDRFNESLEGVDIRWGLQTNGLLLDEEWLRLFADYNLKFGISLDGPAEVNDRRRIDHHGTGSYSRILERFRYIGSRDGRRTFAGFLTVIDPESNPLEVFHHLLRLEPRTIDFLLPLANWDNIPLLKRADPMGLTPFADWLIPIFDEWFDSRSDRVEIRTFEQIIELLAGGSGSLESLGVQPANLILVAPNGDIEAVDTLKSIPGQQLLGLNVRDNSFEEVLGHPKYLMRQTGVNGLASVCQACPIVGICGGGYLPHRWSTANSFYNPSVYCADLTKLIRHIENRVVRELDCESESKDATELA